MNTTFNYEIGTELVETHERYYGNRVKIVSETKTTWILDNGIKVSKEPKFSDSNVLYVYGKKNEYYSNHYIAYELVKEDVCKQTLRSISNITKIDSKDNPYKYDFSKIDIEMVENFKKMLESAKVRERYF